MLSKICFYVSAVVLIISAMLYPRWEKAGGNSTFGWDVSGYYWYLPSTIIYKDIKKQSFADSVIARYQFTPTFIQGFKHSNGNYVLTYTAGMAIMYAPFFTAAHLLSGPLGYPADGFSRPYQFAISFGSLMVAIVGMWYLRRLFKYYYSDSTVAILLLLLVIGTNYLNYTAFDGALTHNWLFTVYVFLLLATRAFYATLKTRYAIAIGLLCGLAILVRPSEIIAVLIPLAWGMEGLMPKQLAARFKFFWEQLPKIGIAIGCLILVCSIQLFYWKYVSGSWLVYSYQDKGFSWRHPHFNDYMLSYRSGWLTYTPLMFFCFIGILPFLRYGKNKVMVLAFFALNLYIVSAWDIWWYGGTGGRAMIQSYPILLFTLASLIEYLRTRKVLALCFAPVILLFVYFNVWFTVQAHASGGLYDPEGMTKAYYWRVVGRWRAPLEVQKLKETDELYEGTPKHLKLLYRNGFDQDSSFSNDSITVNGSMSLYLDKQHSRSKTYSFPYKKGNASWIRAQATFHTPQKEWTNWLMAQFWVDMYNNDTAVKERVIRIHRLMSDGETKKLYIDVKVPEQEFDSIKVRFWNGDSLSPIVIDDLEVYEFSE